MTPRLATALLLSLAALATSVHAQSFPSKPLHIIVPFPPGGAADVTSRLLGEHMAKGLGQSVIVENRPGAGAVIGYELGARAQGDGHTLLVVFPSFIIQPTVKQGLQFDPLKDFKAVGQTISLPMAFAINPSVPAATPPSTISRLNAELVQALRNAKIQEKFKTYGMSPAPGTPEQLAALLQSESTRYAKVVHEVEIKAD